MDNFWAGFEKQAGGWGTVLKAVTGAGKRVGSSLASVGGAGGWGTYAQGVGSAISGGAKTVSKAVGNAMRAKPVANPVAAVMSKAGPKNLATGVLPQAGAYKVVPKGTLAATATHAAPAAAAAAPVASTVAPAAAPGFGAKVKAWGAANPGKALAGAAAGSAVVGGLAGRMSAGGRPQQG